ncbi:hypothetical protein ABZ816_41895 [Actinosynnema sp. NPDC047251]|uniref:Uncharacterized protein n=1 Tax=Saccharothrix espanaensis (strain ATCC 51144 / DSM 44229 / JCM 9112 / NBRC 15066 / NRRL 15764) TaxID=1179773 RepID=K0KA17_SACES|nr:hypothetical protein [Saccharothrix espanaensis]CCH35166.1 hypothetical protein BN6_79480 [Saccharothrix espanaensis DSM 44229]
MITVVETPLAGVQSAHLRGPARQAYDRFLDELAHSGCAALGYRVTGPEPLPRLCVKHLRGTDRVIVAFPDPATAWVLLVGTHEDDPGRNLYDALYELAGVRPRLNERRTKPPCCADGTPPAADADLVDELVARARALAKSRRRP